MSMLHGEWGIGPRRRREAKPHRARGATNPKPNQLPQKETQKERERDKTHTVLLQRRLLLFLSEFVFVRVRVRVHVLVVPRRPSSSSMLRCLSVTLRFLSLAKRGRGWGAEEGGRDPPGKERTVPPPAPLASGAYAFVLPLFRRFAFRLAAAASLLHERFDKALVLLSRALSAPSF